MSGLEHNGYQSPYADLLKIKMTSVTKDKIRGELSAAADMLNLHGTMHGGAILSLADHVGGMAARMHIGADQGTVTIESKINFFQPVGLGDVAYAEAQPLHIGRTTSVWQIRVTRGDGKLVAQCTQTQLVTSTRSNPSDQNQAPANGGAYAIGGGSAHSRQRLLTQCP